jgi:hypothetical protein
MISAVPHEWPPHHRGVGNGAAASVSDTPACQEINTWGAKPTIGDVRRDHLVAVRSEGGGHRSGTTARLPDGATKLEPLEQRLGDPIRRGVEVAAFPVESGYVDGAII